MEFCYTSAYGELKHSAESYSLTFKQWCIRTSLYKKTAVLYCIIFVLICIHVWLLDYRTGDCTLSYSIFSSIAMVSLSTDICTYLTVQSLSIVSYYCTTVYFWPIERDILLYYYFFIFFLFSVTLIVYVWTLCVFHI